MISTGEEGIMVYCYTVCVNCFNRSVQNRRSRKGVRVEDFELQHSAHVGQSEYMRNT